MINHLSNDKDSKVNIHKAKNEIVSKEYESTENTTIIDNSYNKYSAKKGCVPPFTQKYPGVQSFSFAP